MKRLIVRISSFRFENREKLSECEKFLNAKSLKTEIFCACSQLSHGLEILAVCYFSISDCPKKIEFSVKSTINGFEELLNLPLRVSKKRINPNMSSIVAKSVARR